MLVNIYLDEILSSSDDQSELTRFDTISSSPPPSISFLLYSSAKLQAFIITSNSYRVPSVLNRVNQTNRLRREVALLYGKVHLFNRGLSLC